MLDTNTLLHRTEIKIDYNAVKINNHKHRKMILKECTYSCSISSHKHVQLSEIIGRGSKENQ